MGLITFKEVANCVGQSETNAAVTFSVPPIHDGNKHFRAFCLSELLVNRIIDERYLGGEVVNVRQYNNDNILVEARLPSCIQTFPILIPMNCIIGHKDNIVLQVRRLERELRDHLYAWWKATKKGTIKFEIQELVNQLYITKKKQYQR